MASKTNENSLNNDKITSIISTEQFSNLSTDVQNNILNSINNNQSKEGGWMGKLFGIKKELASMNIALTICIILLIAGFFVKDSSYWDKVIPIIAATIGYIFGSRSSKSD